MGQERFQRDKIVRHVLARFGSEDSQDWNVMKARGSEVRWAEVVGAARTMPMMATYRFMVLSGLEDAREKGGDSDAVIEYLKDPSPSACLLVDAEGADLRRQPLAAMVKAAVVVECKPLSVSDAVSFATGFARERGVQIDREAASALVERIGVSMGEIASEIERLQLYVHPRTAIAVADITRAVGASRERSVFEYVGALSARDLPRAVMLLRTLVGDGEAPLGILALIERQFRMMLAAAESRAAGASPPEACRAAGVPPFMVDRFLGELRSWPVAKLRDVYPRFLRKDQEIKSRGVSQATELELLTAEILSL